MCVSQSKPLVSNRLKILVRNKEAGEDLDHYCFQFCCRLVTLGQQNLSLDNHFLIFLPLICTVHTLVTYAKHPSCGGHQLSSRDKTNEELLCIEQLLVRSLTQQESE